MVHITSFEKDNLTLLEENVVLKRNVERLESELKRTKGKLFGVNEKLQTLKSELH